MAYETAAQAAESERPNPLWRAVSGGAGVFVVEDEDGRLHGQPAPTDSALAPR